MNDPAFRTVFGSIENYHKGSVEITTGSARDYAFSNIFEVASTSRPYEKVVVGKNLEYVIEVLRTEGRSAWFACAHDEFTIQMDGEVRIDFVKLDTPLSGGSGTVRVNEDPVGRSMGHVVLRKGHQAILPAGSAYRFTANTPGVALVQTILGELSVEKWADVCLH